MNTDFLFEMLSCDSVSGHEIGLQKKVRAHMADCSDAVYTDPTGGLICALNPESPVKVLLAGHIDEIGLVVTHITDSGMLKVAKAGGIQVRQYPGHKVRIYTAQGILYGAVVNSRSLQNNADLSVTDLTIDIGADSRKQAQERVAIGDTVTFDTDVRPLLGGRISARAVDNRGGAFIVLEALRRARSRGCTVGVYAATTPGEETTMRGAYFAAARVKPTLAIAVDVTYATDCPGSDPADTGFVALGKGPVLCCSSLVSPKLNALLREAALAEDIPFQLETAVGLTHTDLDKMHFAAEGIPTALVSLPLRYMHSPNEVADLADIENCIRLLTAFLMRIDETISLDPFAE